MAAKLRIDGEIRHTAPLEPFQTIGRLLQQRDGGNGPRDDRLAGGDTDAQESLDGPPGPGVEQVAVPSSLERVNTVSDGLPDPQWMKMIPGDGTHANTLRTHRAPCSPSNAAMSRSVISRCSMPSCTWPNRTGVQVAWVAGVLRELAHHRHAGESLGEGHSVGPSVCAIAASGPHSGAGGGDVALIVDATESIWY